MKTIVFGVDDSPGARAAVRIAAALAQGLGGRIQATTTHQRRKPTMSVVASPRAPQTSSASPTVAQAPIVAAVDGSTASRAAVDAAVRLGRELGAPIVFVYVRRGPSAFWGSPVYQRRLTAEMTRARRVLTTVLTSARRAGVDAEGEILEGKPRQRILELADDRGAQLVVVGTRGRRLRRSVSTSVSQSSERPVVVARRLGRLAVASAPSV
jgi:nucleotide-binding universal stress UspA family protein